MRLKNTFHTQTLTQLHEGLCNRLLFSPAEKLDDINSVDVQLHNVLATAESINYDTHIDRVWVSRNRWNTLIRQYLDPQELLTWLDTIENAFPSSKRGIAVLRTNTVQKRITGRGVTRRWGSCMLSLSFRRRPWPQITLHSRTSYLGYLSLLDLAVPYVCAKLIANRVGMNHEDIAFAWSLEMAQYHGFRCIAHPLGDDELYQRFLGHDHSRAYPGVRLARMWHDRMVDLDRNQVLYSEMKFSSYRRVRKRWHSQMKGMDYAEKFARYDLTSDAKAYAVLPHIHVSDLNFSAIGVLE